MFPTRVGMNRPRGFTTRIISNVPHPRGDEPNRISGLNLPPAMFPTRVGMNRIANWPYPNARYVPHPRGDEPLARVSLWVCSLCSPPAWG